jgi:predicted NBD/HSP70 family sugar kinase
MTIGAHNMLQIGIDIGGTSVKSAAVRDGAVLWTGRSQPYLRPGRAELQRAILEATKQLDARPDATGVCCPGLLDETRTQILHAINVPGLMEISLPELLNPLGAPRKPIVASDANATAYDIYASRHLKGRLLVVVMGTGVGAGIVDDGGELLNVDGDSAGHFGQCDVSLDANPPIGPDGGAGSLEAYVGVPALVSAYGSVENAFSQMKPADPAMRALARILRVAHGIYRPQHVCMAGGIGIRLAHILPELKALVDDRLTRLARQDWTLTASDNDFHAAIGVARLAK